MLAKNFIHPLDRTLTEKIFQTDSVKNMLENLHDDELDNICAYVYSASLPEISDKALHKMALVACNKFHVEPVKLYLKRSYDFEVECVGYHEPIVILPAALLERDDYEIIQGRLFAIAGSIAANHHKLAFLLWMAENLSGIANFPLIGQVVKGFFYEWARARKFTLDRAFLLATKNLPLTLKNILYGILPFDVLENFHFDDENDSFMEQTQRYLRNDNPAQMLSKAFSFFSDYSWLPRRYEEVQTFYRKGDDSYATAL